MMTRKLLLQVAASLLVFMFACDLQAQTELSKWDKADGFVLLFDGESSEGWRGYQKDFFPERWLIEDGTLHFNPDVEGSRGDIVYDKKFKNFHLKLEWKIAEGGNSGIFYLGSEDETFNAIYRTAPEMQVLDDEKHPDAKMGTDGNRTSGSLYDLIPADPQNSNGAEKWNSAEVICKDGHVIHMQNGEKVVEYQIGTQMWSAMVARSKFPGLNPDWVNLQEEGVIGLQDHGDHVWYRNIMIKLL